MTRKSKLIAACTIALGAVCSLAYATDLGTKGLGFIAPSVTGKANVYSPATGEIVYDQSDSTFYGYNHSTAWTALNGGSGDTPAGTILPYAGTTAPSGYLLCNGSAVSRTTYATLYGVIGSTFGSGDGSTTFNLPDLRGRFLRGLDSSAGNDPDAGSRTAMTTGGNTGDNVGSVQGDAFQGFGLQGQRYTTTLSDANRLSTASVSPGNTLATVVSSTITSSALVNDGTYGTPRISHETRPKNVNVNYIIKL